MIVKSISIFVNLKGAGIKEVQLNHTNSELIKKINETLHPMHQFKLCFSPAPPWLSNPVSYAFTRHIFAPGTPETLISPCDCHIQNPFLLAFLNTYSSLPSRSLRYHLSPPLLKKTFFCCCYLCILQSVTEYHFR